MLGIFSLLLIAGFGSAAITFSNVPTLSRTGNSAAITITGITSNPTLTPIIQNGKTINFTATHDSITNITTINYSATDFNFYFGKTYPTTLTAINGSENATQTISFEVATPNEYSNYNNNLQVNIDDISVEEGFGEDTDWYPMDEIQADIEIRNDNGDNEIRDIVVEWGLYDVENGNWIVKDKENDFDLDDDEEKTLTITFQLDKDAIDELDVDVNNYKFYVWATGEDEENSWKNETSEYDVESIDMRIEGDFVILNNIAISSESVSCGNEIQITADVWNIGEEDQDDVYVIIYNKELGMNQKVTLGDIDSFEDSKLDATLIIPATAEEKSYRLDFSIYNEDDENYETEDDEESESYYVLDIEGTCSTTPKILVSANLESDAVAGKELIVKAIVENTGSKISTLTLGLSGYTEWASLVSIDKETLILDAGNSEEVLITLKINNDISGDQNFDVVITEGDKVLTQPVAVSVEKPSLFPDITGWVSGIAGDNWYLWGIGALNVLLVFIIIVVAMKVARKKEEPVVDSE